MASRREARTVDMHPTDFGLPFGMIRASEHSPPFRITFSNDTVSAVSDVPADKGGSGQGFRPHELLEAALATCVNMTVWGYARNHGMALRHVEVTVSLDRTDPAVALFRYDVRCEGDLTPEQRKQLLEIAQHCPVRKTLSRAVRFEAHNTTKE
jgi:putative redox protein